MASSKKKFTEGILFIAERSLWGYVVRRMSDSSIGFAVRFGGLKIDNGTHCCKQLGIIVRNITLT